MTDRATNIVIAVIIVIAFLAVLERHHEDEPKQQQQQTQDKGGAVAPAVSNPTSQPPAIQPNDKTHEWPDAKYRAWIAAKAGKVWAWLSWTAGSGPADWFLVLVGVTGIIFALQSITAVRRQADAAFAAQRAYVALSPAEPGIQEIGGTPQIQLIRFQIRIHNWGDTPADVVDVALFIHIGPLPPPQPIHYDPVERLQVGDTQAFLVRGGNVFVGVTHQIDLGTWQDITHVGDPTLWILGYVDYIDRFHRRHRGGFARRYSVGMQPNNLLFEARGGYNYDWEIDEEGKRKT